MTLLTIFIGNESKNYCQKIYMLQIDCQGILETMEYVPLSKGKISMLFLKRDFMIVSLDTFLIRLSVTSKNSFTQRYNTIVKD